LFQEDARAGAEDAQGDYAGDVHDFAESRSWA
jgi:hypothetical protein